MDINRKVPLILIGIILFFFSLSIINFYFHSPRYLHYSSTRKVTTQELPLTITSGYAAGRIACLAAITKNISLCQKIQKGFDLGPGPDEKSLRATCYFELAHYMKDSSRIDTHCYGFFDQDPICNYISDNSLKEACFMHIAVNAGNRSFCETVTDQSHRDDCYLGIASKYFDSNLCIKIVSVAKRSDCLSAAKQ